MPVGKPAPDGEGVTSASRRYTGHAGTLGPIAAWDCPACGKKNDGRKPEHGCIHCGAGDPTQSRAGTPEGPPRAQLQSETMRQVPGKSTARVTSPSRPGAVPLSPDPGIPALRVLRLVEYVIAAGHNADDVLRRSLVGRIDFPWGSITGTVVDSADDRQEDLLRLARKQPGIWVGNPLAMADQGIQVTSGPRARAQVSAGPTHPRPMQGMPAGVDFVPVHQEPIMDLPDTGPAFSEEEALLAQDILELGNRALVDGGLKLCYTLALALQTIAPELGANMEPEKFLTPEECLSLANALMQEIPADWNPTADAALDAALPPPAPSLQEQESRNAARARVALVREGSKPTATPWKDPIGGPGVE